MSRLGPTNHLKHCFDNRTLILIINTFSPQSGWSNTSQSNIAKLQAVQNFACKIVGGAQRNDHVTSILRQLKWLPVKHHLYYRDLMIAFKSWTALSQSIYLISLLSAHIYKPAELHSC